MSLHVLQVNHQVSGTTQVMCHLESNRHLVVLVPKVWKGPELEDIHVVQTFNDEGRPLLRPSFNVVALFHLVRYFIAFPMFIGLYDSYPKT
jgi:hypothetical protein